MRIVFRSATPPPAAGGLIALLEQAGHRVTQGAARAGLRELATREAPQLLLLEGEAADAALLAEVDALNLQGTAPPVILLCANPAPDYLLRAMRAGVREVLPAPPPADDLLAAIARIEARGAGTTPRAAARVLAFIGCKGGAGATFLATNLAHQLGEGSKVLLVDLDLQHGDALSFVHEGEPASTLADLARRIDRLDASLLDASTVRVSPGLSVLAAPDDPTLATDIGPEQLDPILDVAAANYDFIVLDLPRHLDPLTLRALDRAGRIHPVLQTGLPHLRGATRLLKMFHELGYPPDRIELLLNRYERGGDIPLETIRRSFGLVPLATVPNAWREVSAAINHGEPISVSARGHAVARNLADRAATLRPSPAPSRGLMGRLFGKASA